MGKLIHALKRRGRPPGSGGYLLNIFWPIAQIDLAQANICGINLLIAEEICFALRKTETIAIEQSGSMNLKI